MSTALAAALIFTPAAFAQNAQDSAVTATHADGTPLTTDEKIAKLQEELDELKAQRNAQPQAAPQGASQAAPSDATAGIARIGGVANPATGTNTNQTVQAITTVGKGLVFTSPDGYYGFAINAQVNVDTDNFGHDGGTLQDQIQDRLIRPTFSGHAGNAAFLITPEFGGTSAAASSIVDAYITYKVAEPVQFKFGKFKSPIGLERLQADADVLWTERGNSTNLVPNRDDGYELFGTLVKGAVEYQLGEFDGAYDSQNLNNDTDNRKDAAYRVFVRPFAPTDYTWLQGFGIGYAGTQGQHVGTTTNTELPSYKTTGQQTFFKYNTNVVSNGLESRSNPEAYLYIANFSLLADYISEKQDVKSPTAAADLTNRALDVSGSWVITGEPTSFTGGVKPFHDFNINGSGWGAWELTARYGYTEIDHAAFTDGFASLTTSAEKATSGGYGIAWYLSQNLKVMADWDHTKFVGGATKGNRPDEDFTSGRVQFRY